MRPSATKGNEQRKDNVMSDYKNLEVWKLSMDLVLSVYDLTKTLPSEERYALGDQMRRAAVSIPSNIAEGQARGSKKEFAHFLNFSFGSLAELETQLCLCERIGYFTRVRLDATFDMIARIQKMLSKLKSSLSVE